MTDIQEFDPSQLAAFAESISVDDIAETEDFSSEVLIPVGKYMNPRRTIGPVSKKFNEKAQKEVVTVTLIFTGGLHAENGNIFGLGNYPEKYWVNSWTREGRPGTTGQTSSLAEYARACGLDTAGKTVKELVELLPETLNTPVMVKVTRVDKGVPTGNILPNGKKEYTNKGLTEKDFLQPDGSYAASVTVDGVVYKGQAKIKSVWALK